MEWTRGHPIGRGATSTVYLAADNNSGELLAVKSTDLCSCSVFLRKEQSFLSKLSSSYIVKYLGYLVTTDDDPNNCSPPTYNLCMEYMSGGTLSDEIRRRGGKLDESLIKLYTYQILQGLDYLHGNGLAHCDIKSRNILVGEEGVKIADLGCAKLVRRVDWIEDFDEGAASKFSGTPAFMAPEVTRGEEQGVEADIWALGCTVIEMATGSGPWPEMNDPASALYQIGYRNSVPELPSWLSEEAKDFLSKCLKRDSKERWTAKELVSHPFVQVSESHLGQYEAQTTSPSGVLDRDLWDLLEVSECSRNKELELDASFVSSAKERIKVLIGGDTFSCLPNRPNWGWRSDDHDDDDWFTVRSNDFEEDPVQDSTTTTYNSIIQEGEIVYTSLYDEMSLDYYYSVETISTNISNETSFVMTCNNANLQKEKKKKKSIFFPTTGCFSCFLLCYFHILNTLILFVSFFIFGFTFTCYVGGSKFSRNRGQFSLFSISVVIPKI
ncbi:mitogen-activated protein kinase kinase kinase 18-like [Humulus lupulus]|uniref:mitogen-activated protein kinase kinase kinase 18-like n=1 Tax=Humulus lupulus TaxID=3486 RepID=UPI002B40202E|nr:mitogen-activated protein kinase kinase kinase 18-like [Humulus lupulus]